MSTYVTFPSGGTDAPDTIVNVDGGADVAIRWPNGTQVLIGRGTTDTDISYIGLSQADGTVYKVFVASGTITTTTGTL